MERRSFIKAAPLAAASTCTTSVGNAAPAPDDLIDRIRRDTGALAADIGADRWQMMMNPEKGEIIFLRRLGNFESAIAHAEF